MECKIVNFKSSYGFRKPSKMTQKHVLVSYYKCGSSFHLDGAPAKGPPSLLTKRLKESSLVGKSQKDIVVCDPGKTYIHYEYIVAVAFY